MQDDTIALKRFKGRNEFFDLDQRQWLLNRIQAPIRVIQ
jgi:hypothetical protein